MLRRPRTRGFTLIELLIVIAIIAILAALNISDDLHQVEKRRGGDPADARARAERLIRKLDDALGA